tara:strand:+ start:139 stop:768 length:630 start_codon:yes stop_codon:yes gene_type:complete
MIQKTITFGKSSVKLVVTGLPDYSNNDSDTIISIISNWKLLILNKPEIEGGIDHFNNIIKAFYEYSYSVLFNNDCVIESRLIDISTKNNGLHDITLKSTKPNVEPMKLTIGNAELIDIINCFDQLINSENVNIDLYQFENNFTKKKFNKFSRIFFINKLIPPLIALFSITISTFFITYLYKLNETSEERVSFVYINKTSNVSSLVIRLY